MSDISLLEEKLKVKFKNKDLLRQALVHRSYLNEHPEIKLSHNERFEFLGDAVLELAVTEFLFNKFKEKQEGELTTLRAALVNAENLSKRAEILNLNDFILLSRGEAQGFTKSKESILADGLEAIIGAIYLDRGFKAAEDFIKREILISLDEILETKAYKDPKSHFQEASQELLGKTPTYEVLKEWGPDHDKHFLVGVYINGEKIAEGEGQSKKEAELNAALAAIKVKHWENY